MRTSDVQVGLVCRFHGRLVKVVRVWGRGRNRQCAFVALDHGLMAVPGSKDERKVRDFADAAIRVEVQP